MIDYCIPVVQLQNIIGNITRWFQGDNKEVVGKLTCIDYQFYALRNLALERETRNSNVSSHINWLFIVEVRFETFNLAISKFTN